MATFFDSRVSKLFISDTGSTSRDISTYVKSVDGLPGPRNLNDVTTFGATGHRYGPGLEEQTVTIELVYSEDASVGSDTVLGPLRTNPGTVTFQWWPSGTSGKLYSGSLWIEDYTIQGRIGNAVLARCSAKIDNGVTRT